MTSNRTTTRRLSKADAWALLSLILAPDKKFFIILFAYSIAISILSLGLPISVQALINSVANTELLTPLATLSVLLLILLSFSSVIRGLKELVSEYFQRHFFTRLSAEITLRSLYSPYYDFESINRNELMNKFFEIVAIQKSLPSLITGVFFISLQTIAGLILSSLYHPFYLVFNLILLVLLYFIFQSHHGLAATHAIEESSQKHRLAAWLQELGRSHHLFKSQRTKRYASTKSNEIVSDYLDARRSHFKHLFFQICYLLVLYTVANAALLFISGLLVLRGELSLGQLVATELIMSGIFVNFYRAGNYLDSYYDILASCDKLRSFFNLNIEPYISASTYISELSFEFRDAVYLNQGKEVELNYKFEPGKQYIIGTTSAAYKTLIRDAILGFAEPESGLVMVNQTPRSELDIHHYRNHISLIDSQGVLEGDIREYLSFGMSHVNDAIIVTALKAVGLYERLDEFGFDLDTALHPSGYPLTRTDTFKLKIARSIIEMPKLVIINDYLSELIIDNNFFSKCAQAYSPNTTILLLDNNVENAVNFDFITYIDDRGFHGCKSVPEMKEKAVNDSD